MTLYESIEYWNLPTKMSNDDLDILQEESSRVETYLAASLVYTPPDNFILAGSREKLSHNRHAYRPNECGAFVGFKSCMEHPKAHLKPIFKSCNILTCPVCVRSAAGVKGFNVTYKKIMPFQRLLARKNSNTLPIHISINPPEDHSLSRKPLDWSDYKAIIKELEVILEPYFHSYVLVYHPDRVQFIAGEPFRIFSPHFHLIAWTKSNYPFIDGKEFYEKTNIVAKNHGILRTLKDIKAVLSYELTHTWVYEYYIEKKIPDKRYQDLLYDYWLNWGSEKDITPPSKTTFEKHHTQCYSYHGLIKPSNLRKISDEIKESIIQTCGHQMKVGYNKKKHIPKYRACGGFMCEVSGVYLIDSSGRQFSPKDLKKFDITILPKDRKKFKVFIDDSEFDLGYFLYTKVKYFEYDLRCKKSG